MVPKQAQLHGMTNNYEQILSYCFRGVAFTKCHGQTETISMSLHHRAADDDKHESLRQAFKLLQFFLIFLVFSSPH